jgi:hypothetical protein
MLITGKEIMIIIPKKNFKNLEEFPKIWIKFIQGNT